MNEQLTNANIFILYFCSLELKKSYRRKRFDDKKTDILNSIIIFIFSAFSFLAPFPPSSLRCQVAFIRPAAVLFF